MGQTVYQGDEIMGLSLVDDPGSVPVTGDKESGYTVRYAGGSGAASIPDDAELTLYVTLEDRITGDRFPIETNRVGPVERIVPWETWPLEEDGRIVITVYNDTLSYDIPSQIEIEDDRTFLAAEGFEASEFTEYQLPSAWTPDGYDFAGWVVHVNNPWDLGEENEYRGDLPMDTLVNEDTFAFRVESPITKDDVERVPPSADGVRYVNVHAVWIKQDPEEELIFLDDGHGSVAAYGMDSPIYSEGYLYLCNYPEPSYPNETFDGWYDEAGNRVDMLVCYFSFTPMLTNEDGSFAGYDWSAARVPVRLTAHWK